MKTKTRRVKDMPFTVIYQKDNAKLRKRFDNPEEAWSFMRSVNGQLAMAFRLG